MRASLLRFLASLQSSCLAPNIPDYLTSTFSTDSDCPCLRRFLELRTREEAAFVKPNQCALRRVSSEGPDVTEWAKHAYRTCGTRLSDASYRLASSRRLTRHLLRDDVATEPLDGGSSSTPQRARAHAGAG